MTSHHSCKLFLTPRRVRKLYIAGARPPHVPMLDEVWGVNHASLVSKITDGALLDGLFAAWPNLYLETAVGEAGGTSAPELPPEVQAVADVVRAQYGHPCSPQGSVEVAAHMIVPAGDAGMLPSPVLVVVAGQAHADLYIISMCIISMCMCMQTFATPIHVRVYKVRA